MTIESPAVLADLNDPDVFVRGVPHETFAHWRRTDPVHLTKHPEGHSYWSVTDVRRGGAGEPRRRSSSRTSAVACSCSRWKRRCWRSRTC